VLHEYLMGALEGGRRGICERFVLPPVFPTDLGHLKDSQPASSAVQGGTRREDQKEKKS